MSRVSNGRLIDVTSLGSQAAAAYGGLNGHPISRRIQAQASRLMREALKSALRDAMLEAASSGLAPRRTGSSIAAAATGARAFGTNFAGLRGHIIAPGRLVAHQNATEITPQNGEYLAVPIFDGVRADGSPKLGNPNQWRRFGSFTIKGKKTGKLYIVRKDPNNSSRLMFLYVLVESVQLSKHAGWASRAWAKQLPYLRAEWDNIVASFMTVDMVGEAYSNGLGKR